jgi:hypothetical protein
MDAASIGTLRDLARPTLLAFGGVLLGATLFAAACGSDEEPTEAASSSSSSATGSGGGGGAAGAGGAGNPLADDCEALCGYLDTIGCTSFPNCAADCPNMFGAPADCLDEFAAQLACWVEHASEFMCTAQQVIPPAACQAEEAAFERCVGGVDPGDYPCMFGVGNVSDTNCARSTGCEDHEFRSVCKEEGAAWVCSCYDHLELLGTCTERDATLACNNDEGCCKPFFVSAYAASP